MTASRLRSASLARRAGWLVMLGGLLAAGCSPRGPQPIALGQEACDYCRMTISDARFGAEAVSRTGRVRKFDSVECLAGFYLKQHTSGEAQHAWVTDFARPGTWVPVDSARFVLVGVGKSPMGRGLRAFSTDAEAADAQKHDGGTIVRWPDVLRQVAAEGDRPDEHGNAHASSDATEVGR